MNDREIPNTISIKTYMHCGKCLDEIPDGTTPKEFSMVQIGWTDIGFQVWCNRHNVNVCHIDFEGQRHPVDTSIFEQKIIN